MTKRRISVVLVLAIVLILVTAGAVAAVLLGGREFVEEVMQPKAMQSTSNRWTETEVEELLRIAEENGLHLDETQQAQLLSWGGYDKEELMRVFMKLGLGKDPTTWSIEDQAWYGQMLVDIGIYDETFSTLPEAGEADEAAMLQAVTEYIHRQYDPQAPLDDETLYRRHTRYQWVTENDGDTPTKRWDVAYAPLDLTYPTYRFALDAQANILHARMEPAVIGGEEQPMPQLLRYRYEELYGNLYQWDMETFVQFGQQLRAAGAVHGYGGVRLLELLSLSEFGLPGGGDLTKNAAIDVAVEAVIARCGVQSSALRRDNAFGVYLLGGDVPVWKITLPAAVDGDYLVEIHAQNGGVQTIDFMPYGTDSVARSYMLDAVYAANAQQTPPNTLRFDNRFFEASTPLADGGFLLAGSAGRENDMTRAWAVRMNADGTTRWEVFNDEGRSYLRAVEMSDGTLLLAMEPARAETFSLALVSLNADGGTLSGPTLLPFRGWAYRGKDCMLVTKDSGGSGVRPSTLTAVDATGQTLWDHTYDELLGSGYHPLATENGYLLYGSAQGYPYNQNSGLWGMVARLDNAGNLLSVRRMDDYPQTGFSAALLMADGGLYGAGMNYGKFEDDAEDAHRLSDFVTRLDADGNVIWWRYYPELEPEHGVLFDDLLPAPDGGVLVLARTLDGNEWSLVQLDEAGDVVQRWHPQFVSDDFRVCGAFSSGDQSYVVYCTMPEYSGTMGPVSTFVMRVVWP